MKLFVEIEGLSHVALNIFNNLDPVSISRCCLVCKSWNLFVSRSRILWTSQLSRFELKTKTTQRIEGKNGYYVLMPRNHKRWKYWKESIKHFIDNEKVEHLKRFFFFLVQEVPFVKDQTEGNVEPKDQWGYEEESLTFLDKLCGDGDFTVYIGRKDTFVSLQGRWCLTTPDLWLGQFQWDFIIWYTYQFLS